MEDNSKTGETIGGAILIFFTVIVLAFILGVIFLSLIEISYELAYFVIGVITVTIISIIVYIFYDLLNKIYKKLDSFDLPIKPQEEIKEESNDAQEQIEEEKDAHIESELDQWKSRAIQSVQKSLENGSINSAQAKELIKRIQEAKQIPVKKNKEDAGA